MLDIGSSELLLIVIVAVVVIGPKELPRMLYKLGQIMGKGRAMTRHFRAGIDEMIRQAEMEDMEKKWAADNARIMAQTAEAEAVQPVAVETEARQDATTSDIAPPQIVSSPAFQVDPGQQVVPPAPPTPTPASVPPADDPATRTGGGSAA